VAKPACLQVLEARGAEFIPRSHRNPERRLAVANMSSAGIHHHRRLARRLAEGDAEFRAEFERQRAIAAIDAIVSPLGALCVEHD
jgi:hypothetical protein